MRNLRDIGPSFASGLEDCNPTACTWDVRTDSAVCVFGPRNNGTEIQVRRWNPEESVASLQELSLIASWTPLTPDPHTPDPHLDHDQILNLHYFPDSRIICLVFACGDLVIVRECPLAGEEQIEVVGSVDAGIISAAWSPDEELLALVSKVGTLIFMSRDFEGVSTASFTDLDLQASKHVSVGWGKTETQFKGKGARAQRDPTIPERIDQGLPSSADNGLTTVSWRGDGAYVAVNSPEKSSRRVIRIFSRDCELDGVSEPVDFLEAALAWRPTGNVIAGVRRLEDQLQVVFFERNGLRHGEFDLRAGKSESSSWASPVLLQWNCDSTILAVCYPDRVQLWTMGNYHYYLKQEFCLSPIRQSFSTKLEWHPEDPMLALIGTAGMTLQESVLKILTNHQVVSADSSMRGGPAEAQLLMDLTMAL